MALQAGTERFWPVTGDMPLEYAKCARIIREFTLEGVESKVEVPADSAVAAAAGNDAKGKKKQVKIIRKMPAKVLQGCKGLVIFTSMRSGM
jgi:hypothetical protein